MRGLKACVVTQRPLRRRLFLETLSPRAVLAGIDVVLDPVPSINETQAAALVGSYTNDNALYAHTVSINWHDWNNANPSTFALPDTNILAPGTFNSSTDGSILTVTAVNAVTGKVDFTVQHVYADDGLSPGNGTLADSASIEVTAAGLSGWSTGVPMLTSGASGPNAVISDKWYVLGPLNNLQVFDPVTGTWTIKASDPIYRSNAAGAAINGKFYVSGGWLSSDSNNSTNQFNVYDPIANSWSSLPAAPLARGSGVGVGIGAKLYVTGGRQGNGSGPFASLDIYDTVSGAWSSGNAMPTAREATMGTEFGGKMLVIGGYARPSGDWNHGYPVANNEAYDPATDTWSTLAPMPVPVWAASIANLNGKIYVVGGIDVLNQPVSTVQIYDPASDSWTLGPATTVARWLTQGTGLGGNVLVAGGYSSTSYTASNAVDVLRPEISDEATTSVTVNNVAPVETLVGPAYVFPNVPAVLTVKATDLNLTEQAMLEFTIDWGDASAPQVFTGVDGAVGLQPSHSFAVPGTYTIVASVKDDDTGSHTLTLPIVVSNIYIENGNLYVSGADGKNDRIVVGPSSGGKFNVGINGVMKTVPAFPGFMEIYGRGGNDTIYFNGNTTKVMRVFGGEGNDEIVTSSGSDWLDGGDGDDRLTGGNGQNTFWGGRGNDVLVGCNGKDLMFGGTENDFMNGGGGDDELHGEDGRDQLIGGLGNDLLDGGPDNDFLRGDAGNDVLWGGTGDDQMYGDCGRDILFGGDGIDYLFGGAQEDLLIGEEPILTPNELAALKSSWFNTAKLPLGFVFTAANVPSDGDADVLNGEAGNNWLVYYPTIDILRCKQPFDRLTKLP